MSMYYRPQTDRTRAASEGDDDVEAIIGKSANKPIPFGEVRGSIVRASIMLRPVSE